MKRIIVGLALLAAACSKDPGGIRASGVHLAVVAGDLQIDTVAQPLDQPVTAKATDTATTKPMSGVVVNWFRVVDGDSVFVGAGATSDSGFARYRPTLAPKSGSQTIVAWALDNEGRKTVYAAATATAVPERAAWIRLIPGFSNSNQVRHVGDTVTMTVRYEDRFSNNGAPCPDNVPWESLTWTVDAAIVKLVDMQRVQDNINSRFVAVGTGGAIFSVTTDCQLGHRTETMTYSLAVQP